MQAGGSGEKPPQSFQLFAAVKVPNHRHLPIYRHHVRFS